MSSPEDTPADALMAKVDSAVDEGRAALVALLSEALGKALLASKVQDGIDVWIRVHSDAWVETSRTLQGHCGMSYFNFLSAIDWQPSPFGRDMDSIVDRQDQEVVVTPTDLEWGVTGGGERFQLLARVHDPIGNLGVHVKCDLEGDYPEVDTWTTVYPGADWHEREAWEMFGITFRGHPNLRHLYLPSEFEGNPLRKDYPLLARRAKPWPGLVDVELMPDEDVDDDGTDES